MSKTRISLFSIEQNDTSKLSKLLSRRSRWSVRYNLSKPTYLALFTNYACLYIYFFIFANVCIESKTHQSHVMEYEDMNKIGLEFSLKFNLCIAFSYLCLYCRLMSVQNGLLFPNMYKKNLIGVIMEIYLNKYKK